MLQEDPVIEGPLNDPLEAQQKDPEVLEMVGYLEHGKLPDNDKETCRTVIRSCILTV